MKLLRLHAGILSTKKRSGKRTETVRARKAADSRRLRVDGAKLRKLREDAELSVRALAFAVGVDPSTVMDLEAGQREWSQLRTVRSSAAHPALDVDYRELLVEEVAPASVVVPKSTTNIAPRSSLDAYVDEERRFGPAPRIETEHGVLPLFGATGLVRVFSSPSSVAGELFCVTGRVHATRGLSYTDGIVLGIRHQTVHASRFCGTSARSRTRCLSPFHDNGRADATRASRLDAADGCYARHSRRDYARRSRRRAGTVSKTHPWALVVQSVVLG